jgi:uncharacterized protein (DUF2267 family)
MSMTGLEVFDSTVHKTNTWLNDLARLLELGDKHEAYQDMRVTLHALRDRLTVEEAAQLSAQLPMLLRGVFFEGWDPTGKPVKERKVEDFVAAMAREYPRDRPTDLAEVATAVFKVMAMRVSSGEIEDVKGLLPEAIRGLWM